MLEWMTGGMGMDLSVLEGVDVIQIVVTLLVVVGGLKVGLGRLENSVETGFKRIDRRCDRIETKLDDGLTDAHTRVTRNAQDIARLDERTKGAG